MKASYKKPMIMFESFELNQSIAQTCGTGDIGNTTHWTKDTCGYKVGDLVMWTDTVTACTYKLDADEAVYGYCYNTPTPDMQIFSS
ncbi:MAG: hypothetical protein LUC83_05305 [Clostridiales bacterium]|nr:hypothetical protein [Clostridiales bacterium]